MDVEVRVAYIFSALAEEETFISSFCLQDTYILFVSFHANLRDTIFLLDFAFLRRTQQCYRKNLNFKDKFGIGTNEIRPIYC